MKFSVLMSVYQKDKLEFLKKAIDSILNQTVQPNEVVIVQDGPVALEIAELLKTYQDEYDFIKIITLEENLGLGNALEVGLQHCSYEIVARMDSDDISIENRFEKQLHAFEKNENLSIAGGQIEEFTDSISQIVGKREVPLQDEQIKEYLKSRCPFNHMTVMFRKAEVERVGGYQEWHFNEDYYLWLRMYLANCQFENLPDTLVYVRTSEDLYQRRGGLQYFKSEVGIQKYMLTHQMIGLGRYCYNVILRFCLQILMPNKVRAFIFKKFARKEAK